MCEMMVVIVVYIKNNIANTYVQISIQNKIG